MHIKCESIASYQWNIAKRTLKTNQALRLTNSAKN